MNGNEGLSASDVALLTGNGNNGGWGMEGGWGSMIWLFAIIALMNGGFGGWGGGFGGAGNMQLGYDFPWLLNGQNGINTNVSDGFRDAQLHDSVSSVRDGVSNLATQLCGCCGDMQMSMANGFAGVQQSLCSGFANNTAAINGAQNAISQQLYSNEIANLNRSFAEQTANTAGFTGVQSGLCDIRYGNANNTRDILNALNAGVQSIKDQMCQDKIDAKNDEIAQLRQEILYSRGQASQDVQTATIRAGQATTANQLLAEMRACPVPSMPVYGQTPIFTCNGNGCGCNAGLNL